MTQNHRIFLNIVATYGRSLYALAIGLFCGRWTLMTLGEVDYGLMGVVGGLTAFVTFLNGIMAGGIGRFYAISVGAAQKDPEKGLEECHKWFTTAVVVHAILPTILMIIGYPIGEWAVRHFLTIPPDRIQSCVWVWRCVCVSTFIGMVGVPFSAWYGAKQEIAELTIYSFITTTLNVCFMYYAVHHPGDWLAPLAVWSMLLSIVPQLLICGRAGMLYPECKFVWHHVRHCWEYVRKMMVYSGWLVIGTLGDLLSGQGISVLVNKFFGPRANAAMNVGNTLAGHCTTLSGSLVGAFWPVITNAYGAGEFEKVNVYAYRVSRLATFLTLLFAIPLILEVDNVLTLWLKNPPASSAGLCVLALIVAVIEKTSFGYAIAAHASGKIALYISVAGGAFLLTLPIAFFAFYVGGSIYWAGGSIVITRTLVASLRVWYARPLVHTSARYWVFKIVFPLLLMSALSVAVGLIPRLFVSANLWRIFVTSGLSDAVLIALTWFFLFDAEERSYLVSRVKSVTGKFGKQKK